MSGSRRKRPQTRARRVDEHGIEHRAKRQGFRRIGLHDADAGGAGGANGGGQQPDPSGADVGSDEHPGVTHACRHRQCLAPGGGAGIEDPLAGSGGRDLADDLRSLVLDDEQSL